MFSPAGFNLTSQHPHLFSHPGQPSVRLALSESFHDAKASMAPYWGGFSYGLQWCSGCSDSPCHGLCSAFSICPKYNLHVSQF
eukprot:5070198-Amphidinium_carterae.2